LEALQEAKEWLERIKKDMALTFSDPVVKYFRRRCKRWWVAGVDLHFLQRRGGDDFYWTNSLVDAREKLKQ